MKPLEFQHKILQYAGGVWSESNLTPPEEAICRIFVNGRQLLGTLCTPRELDSLALGCLYLDGLIDSTEDICSVEVDKENCTVNVELKNPPEMMPEQRILTTGLGMGSIPADMPMGNVPTEACLDYAEIPHLMSEFVELGSLYRQTGGVHASALYKGGKFLAHAEDVGRHNTLDKIVGDLLLKGLSARGATLFTTGRVSSEMVLKSARAGIPFIASLSAATTRAVGLADNLKMTILGYIGNGSLTVYSAPNLSDRTE